MFLRPLPPELGSPGRVATANFVALEYLVDDVSHTSPLPPPETSADPRTCIAYATR